MNPLDTLPYELFEEILMYILDTHAHPYLIPTVNKAWARATLPLLHSRVILTSSSQLFLFATSYGRLECAIRGGRHVEIRLPGGTQSTGVWDVIRRALRKCEHGVGGVGRRTCCRGIRSLKLVMNSHLSDPGVHSVGEVLGQLSPEIFCWTGPDPDHHFSTAIVPTAANELCKAIRSWSSLRVLALSNMSFLHDGRELAAALLGLQSERADSESRTLHVSISKAVFMQPSPVLEIALGCPSLIEIRLIDVYQHSIWGSRLRRKDVEAILDSLPELTDQRKAELLEIVKMVVKCGAKTERLMGGDRELS